jgi:hypothetical protein
MTTATSLSFLWFSKILASQAVPRVTNVESVKEIVIPTPIVRLGLNASSEVRRAYVYQDVQLVALAILAVTIIATTRRLHVALVKILGTLLLHHAPRPNGVPAMGKSDTDTGTSGQLG